MKKKRKIYQTFIGMVMLVMMLCGMHVAAERLKNVVIENLDFEHLIKTYDRETALFYMDPPYYQAEKYYPDRFQPEDHERLKDVVDQIKGKVIISYNDCQEIRKLYHDYKIIEAERNNNLNTGKRYRELIIKNW